MKNTFSATFLAGFVGGFSKLITQSLDPKTTGTGNLYL